MGHSITITLEIKDLANDECSEMKDLKSLLG
jgi:hypothetical protein